MRSEFLIIYLSKIEHEENILINSSHLIKILLQKKYLIRKRDFKKLFQSIAQSKKVNHSLFQKIFHEKSNSIYCSLIRIYDFFYGNLPLSTLTRDHIINIEKKVSEIEKSDPHKSINSLNLIFRYLILLDYYKKHNIQFSRKELDIRKRLKSLSPYIFSKFLSNQN